MVGVGLAFLLVLGVSSRRNVHFWKSTQGLPRVFPGSTQSLPWVYPGPTQGLPRASLVLPRVRPSAQKSGSGGWARPIRRCKLQSGCFRPRTAKSGLGVFLVGFPQCGAHILGDFWCKSTVPTTTTTSTTCAPHCGNPAGKTLNPDLAVRGLKHPLCCIEFLIGRVQPPEPDFRTFGRVAHASK